MAEPLIGRLVGIVPTFREGPLAAAAIRSILPHVDNVVTFEGPVGDVPDEGYETELRAFAKNSRVIRKSGRWKSEAEKRNAMLDYTRRMPTPTWGVYVDADEIFIGGEFIRDYIWAAHVHAEEGRDVTAIPVNVTEVDGSVGQIHRILRLDRLERHVLSMSQLKFYDSDLVVTFPNVAVWRPGEDVTETQRQPLQGEPHIHHRSYYRPPVRGEHRLHKLEVDDYLELERAERERLGLKAGPGGHVPVLQDPGFIVAHETDEQEQGGDPLERYFGGRKQ